MKTSKTVIADVQSSSLFQSIDASFQHGLQLPRGGREDPYVAGHSFNSVAPAGAPLHSKVGRAAKRWCKNVEQPICTVGERVA